MIQEVLQISLLNVRIEHLGTVASFAKVNRNRSGILGLHPRELIDRKTIRFGWSLGLQLCSLSRLVACRATFASRGKLPGVQVRFKGTSLDFIVFLFDSLFLQLALFSSKPIFTSFLNAQLAHETCLGSALLQAYFRLCNNCWCQLG